MKFIAQGAEAKLYETAEGMLKERPPKAYRVKELDDELRKARTKREARVLQKLLENGVPVPKVLKATETGLLLEKIPGETLRDALNESNCRRLCLEAGEGIGKMHSLEIIHGDLTTSNMLFSKGRVFFIDFGLSFHSHKLEDKAVDLHVFREALQSKHYKIADECYTAAVEGYSQGYPKAHEVLARLKSVESRGRYKNKD